MLLNIKQAAAALQVSANFVYRLVGSRLIRHERHGKGKRAVIRIPEEALDEYRRSRTVAVEEKVATSPPPPRQRETEMGDLRRKHLGL